MKSNKIIGISGILLSLCLGSLAHARSAELKMELRFETERTKGPVYPSVVHFNHSGKKVSSTHTEGGDGVVTQQVLEQVIQIGINGIGQPADELLGKKPYQLCPDESTYYREDRCRNFLTPEDNKVEGFILRGFGPGYFWNQGICRSASMNPENLNPNYGDDKLPICEELLQK